MIARAQSDGPLRFYRTHETLRWANEGSKATNRNTQFAGSIAETIRLLHAGSNEARRPYGSATRAAASKGGRDRHTNNYYAHFMVLSQLTCILNSDIVPQTVIHAKILDIARESVESIVEDRLFQAPRRVVKF